MNKPTYQQWKEGTYSSPGGFELKMFLAYEHAGDDNRVKLAKIFPYMFGTILDESLERIKIWLEESESISEVLYNHGEMDKEESLEAAEENIKDSILDGANPIDLYIKIKAYQKEYPEQGDLENYFWKLLNEVIS